MRRRHIAEEEKRRGERLSQSQLKKAGLGSPALRAQVRMMLVPLLLAVLLLVLTLSSASQRTQQIQRREQAERRQGEGSPVRNLQSQFGGSPAPSSPSPSRSPLSAASTSRSVRRLAPVSPARPATAVIAAGLSPQPQSTAELFFRIQNERSARKGACTAGLCLLACACCGYWLLPVYAGVATGYCPCMLVWPDVTVCALQC